MSLITRPKPKAYARKRQAQHHRRSKHYIKTYLPYLPMLVIVGLGAFISKVWTNSAASGQIGTVLPTSRLAALTGHASISQFYGVLLLTFAAFATFVIIQWYRVRRMLSRGEAFLVKHPWLDVSLVLLVTAGVVLTRA